MSRYYNDELEHADREWKHHTYLKKYRGKNGKWVYVYKRKHNQVALNGNGGSTPYGSESDTERISNSAHEALNRLRNKNSRAARTADVKMKSTISTAKRRVNNAIRDVQNGINETRNKNARAARTADVKMKSTISTAKRRVNNSIRDVQNDAERISNSAHGALNRLRNKNSRAARTADIRTKAAISRTVNKANKAAGNTAKAVTKGLNDFANDAVNAQRDKNKQMERRRRATQRRRKRVIRATKSKLSTAYNNAKNKAVNKTVDYLDSLFR